MALAREAMGLAPDGYRTDDELAELAFGDWEGMTIAQLHYSDPQRIAAREHDKWRFVPPQGESYEMVAARMRGWYERLTGDVVAGAQGGSCRGVTASLDIAKASDRPPARPVRAVRRASPAAPGRGRSRSSPRLSGSS